MLYGDGKNFCSIVVHIRAVELELNEKQEPSARLNIVGLDFNPVYLDIQSKEDS